MKKLIKQNKENSISFDIVISGLIKRFDRDLKDVIKRINEKLKRWCIGKGISMITIKFINLV